MTEGKVRKVFPGGNTALGFYSFYDHIIDPRTARRILVIKGGPGVGKSSFMRALGEELRAMGFDVEHHCCSSDNGSLDGVVFPAFGVALLDGTSPHVVDPRNPGAVDEIIHLGDHWNEAGLRASREAILKLNREVGRLFRRAYGYLAQAKLLNDEVESYYLDSGSLDLAGLNRQGRLLVEEIFAAGPQDRAPRARHLFASAITPDGPVNHFPTIFDDLPKRYVITGAPGTGKSTLVRKIFTAALAQGYDVEAFHCSLEPDRLEHLIIPALGVAVVTSIPIHRYAPRFCDHVIDTANFVDARALAPFAHDLEEASERFREALRRAVSFIRRAKETHDEMETYYVPHMDFAAIDARREEVRQRLLNYAREAM